MFVLISARGEGNSQKIKTEALWSKRHKTLWARREKQQSYKGSILLRLRKPCLLWKAHESAHEDATTQVVVFLISLTLRGFFIASHF